MALLDKQELRNVATGFRRAFRLPEDGEFDELLVAIERANRAVGAVRQRRRV